MQMTSTSTPTRPRSASTRATSSSWTCASPTRWDAGRIAGARHIELERLASEAGSLDRDRPVLFYCRLGARSGMAASAFRRAGFEAYSIDGGLTEWHSRGLPLEPDDGSVAEH